MSQVLRKCNKCGFEAHTAKDLEIFKTHSRYDKYYNSYPYGKDPVCLKCYRAYDNAAHKKVRAENPTKLRKRVMAQYYKDPSKTRARDYSYRFIEADNTCALCGVTGVPLEKHHPNYKKPDFVITLCRSCHHKLHVGKRVSTQNKSPICDVCSFHPNIDGTFICGFWKRYITEQQKRKNYCKGFKSYSE